MCPTETGTLDPAAYILSRQASLFDHADVVGFGDAGFRVQCIERDLADELVVANHYSGKTVPSARLHFGVIIAGELLGVLTLGVAMNPQSMGSVVRGTGLREYLELNRMWLDDRAPRNSESRALAYSIRLIRRLEPRVKWIQSFADERCGRLGVVYQAANFRYYGEHRSRFWELDGRFFHDQILTNSKHATTPSGRLLHENRARLQAHWFRQFRYLYFLKPRFAQRCLLKEQPFPKPSAACPVDEPAPAGASEVQPLEAAPIASTR